MHKANSQKKSYLQSKQIEMLASHAFSIFFLFLSSTYLRMQQGSLHPKIVLSREGMLQYSILNMQDWFFARSVYI